MPLVISTTNTPEKNLAGVVDAVDTDGLDLSPPLRWSAVAEEWVEGMSQVEDAYVQLLESSTIPGYYERSISQIDGAAENVRITIVNADDGKALGILYNIPLPLIAPEVTIDLTVEEDRN